MTFGWPRSFAHAAAQDPQPRSLQARRPMSSPVRGICRFREAHNRRWHGPRCADSLWNMFWTYFWVSHLIMELESIALRCTSTKNNGYTAKGASGQGVLGPRGARAKGCSGQGVPGPGVLGPGKPSTASPGWRMPASLWRQGRVDDRPHRSRARKPEVTTDQRSPQNRSQKKFDNEIKDKHR